MDEKQVESDNDVNGEVSDSFTDISLCDEVIADKTDEKMKIVSDDDNNPVDEIPVSKVNDAVTDDGSVNDADLMDNASSCVSVSDLNREKTICDDSVNGTKSREDLRVKSRSGNHDIPVVMLSGSSDPVPSNNEKSSRSVQSDGKLDCLSVRRLSDCSSSNSSINVCDNSFESTISLVKSAIKNVGSEVDDDDALISELESELQLDSDASSQTTDVMPASDDDLSSRLSRASSDMSLSNSSNLNHPSNKCDYDMSYNGKIKSILYQGGMASSSPSTQDPIHNAEYYDIQMEALERTIVHLRQDVCHYKQQAKSQEEQSKISLERTKSELSAKIDKVSKMFEGAKKEKESMVMKYAKSEKEKIKFSKTVEDVERKYREAGRDKEMLLSKMKQISNERNHLSSNLEEKVNENKNLIREFDKLKEEISSKDIKIKWAQNKLKSECEAHKETQSKLEKVHQKLMETREESEQIRRDCQDMIRRYQESEEIKSVSLDKELKAKVSELEIQKQEIYDQEEIWTMMKNELVSFKKKNKQLINENNSLTVKIQELEKERLDYDQSVSKLKDNLNNEKQENVDLRAKLAEMDSLTIQLNREREKSISANNEIERLRRINAELQGDMDSCHAKEGELLDFTQRITSKNVQLQSELSVNESKITTMENEITKLTRRYEELERKLSSRKDELDDEKSIRQKETQLLARKLAEKTKAYEQVMTQLEDSSNENRVMKRRHLASVRELTRELHHNKRRLELLEVNNHPQNGCSDRMSVTSRTSSTGSLDTMANNLQYVNSSNHSSTPSVTFIGVRDNNKANAKLPETVQEQPKEENSILQPNRQVLIEKIVKLQRIHARKREKIEFLEDHIQQLLNEIRKKSKIIQSYILREEAGALISNSMDQNKVELSKKGGVMASVFTASHSVDGTMTLDLSLEINAKLQAVLEDTLLKNITLKENISTLGEEIARLTSHSNN